MKKSLTLISVSFVMLVFVNFMFSNAIFTHVHKGVDGRSVTHSHPYLPSGSHGHTALSLDLVAAFNTASVSAMAEESAWESAPVHIYSLISTDIVSFAVVSFVSAYSLRGPPALCV